MYATGGHDGRMDAMGEEDNINGETCSCIYLAVFGNGFRSKYWSTALNLLTLAFLFPCLLVVSNLMPHKLLLDCEARPSHSNYREMSSCNSLPEARGLLGYTHKLFSLGEKYNSLRS